VALTNQYIIDLRAGKIPLAVALTKPQTKQSYSLNGNPVNLSKYLGERGYDISRPENIANSVLMTPTKQDVFREASMEKTKQIRLEKEQVEAIKRAQQTQQATRNYVSRPVNNSVSTVDLGGDRQEQETDVSTNVTPTTQEVAKVELQTNLVSGMGIAVLGGIAVLTLLNRGRK
jgi:hypothetical protein